MKKVLVIMGSYREKGDTVFLVDNFINGFRLSAPHSEIEIVDLKKIDMAYCRGCWTCANPDNIGKPIGNCPIQDDVRLLLDKSLACDVLVYATPVYEMGPSAVMKKFLERNLPVLGGIKLGFYGRNPRRENKCGIIILSTGAPYPLNMLFGFTRYPKKILSLFCRFHACGTILSLSAGGIGGSEQIRAQWGRKAYRLGRKVSLKFARSGGCA